MERIIEESNESYCRARHADSKAWDQRWYELYQWRHQF